MRNGDPEPKLGAAMNGRVDSHLRPFRFRTAGLTSSHAPFTGGSSPRESAVPTGDSGDRYPAPEGEPFRAPTDRDRPAGRLPGRRDPGREARCADPLPAHQTVAVEVCPAPAPGRIPRRRVLPVRTAAEGSGSAHRDSREARTHVPERRNAAVRRTDYRRAREIRGRPRIRTDHAVRSIRGVGGSRFGRGRILPGGGRPARMRRPRTRTDRRNGSPGTNQSHADRNRPMRRSSTTWRLNPKARISKVVSSLASCISSDCVVAAQNQANGIQPRGTRHGTRISKRIRSHTG